MEELVVLAEDRGARGGIALVTDAELVWRSGNAGCTFLC